MKILVIGGFLGSGKTTLLLRVARALVARTLKIAVIENEVGAIGIDGRRLKLEGIEFHELFGGCVCCTLNGRLASMLTIIETALTPDWVLLEPSGVASPTDLVDSLRNCRRDTITVVNLLDAPRFSGLVEILEPMVEGYIASADFIAINKVDQVALHDLQDIRARIGAIAPGKAVVEISASTGSNVDALIGELIAR